MEINRKAVHFDFDTKALERYYPTDNWRKAYKDVRDYLCNNGFEHEQGSDYRSLRPMTEVKVVACIKKMRKKHTWLNKCVRVCTVTDVSEHFDLSEMFNKSINVPERKAHTKTNIQDEMDY